MKKVCFVVNNLRYFLSHRYDLAVLLTEKFGYEVHVITSLRSSSNEEKDACYKNNITLHSLDGRIETKKIISYISKLRTILKKEHFDTVFFVTLEISFFGAFISLTTKLNKIFFVISGVGHNFFNSKIKYKTIRFAQLKVIKTSGLMKKGNFIFQNSDDMKIFSRILSLPSERLFLIKGNGIDVKKFYYKRRDYKELNLCYAGRATHSKGFLTLISALQKLRNQRPKLRFKLIACILTDTKSSNDSIDVDYLMNRDNLDFVEVHYDLDSESLVKIYHQCSIFILPSEREGISKAALEASATGMAILSSDAIGSRESVIEGFNGLRFRTGDSDHLLSQLIEMLSSKEKLQSFSENSKGFILKDYSVTTIAQEFNNIIQS